MKIEHISTEVRDNIAIITLNNPNSLNSINEKMLSELAWQIREYDRADNVKVMILKGIEKSFSTGIDIKGIAANIGNARSVIQNMQHQFKSISNSRKPLIAAISGFALGVGCEIALCCDIVLATDSARFGLPELSIGLLPCFGGCGLLVSRIGRAKAMDMILTGKAISADEAEKIGLISRVVTESSMTEEYTKIAQRIALLPPNTVGLAKKTINAYANPEGLQLENLLSLCCVESSEFKQTLLNFSNKKA